MVAPAKVNLFLGIGEMHDTLTVLSIAEGAYAADFARGDGWDLPTVDEQGLSVGIEVKWHEGLPEDDIPLEKNLVTKAVFALARAFDFPWKGYLRFSIDKHIPAQGGLGGGSSDAAAALLTCASLWGLDSADEALERIAREVGIDTAFFLKGGCALLQGRGDEFVRALMPRTDNVVLIVPEKGVSTAEAYRCFDEHAFAVAAEDLKAAAASLDAASVPLVNNLAPAAELLLPELADIRAWALEQSGVRGALLSGSGSATFVICENHEAALRLAVAAQQQGHWARTTAFSALRAAAIPTRR